MTEQVGRRVIEWGSAGVALEPENSGDVAVVTPFPDGVLVAVIDGLGHGVEAATAAREAARILEAHAGETVSDLVRRCHEGLRKTRGAVMSLASFDSRSSSVTWIGVGNVEGILVLANRAAEPSRETIAAKGGVVGYQLPPLKETVPHGRKACLKPRPRRSRPRSPRSRATSSSMPEPERSCLAS